MPASVSTMRSESGRSSTTRRSLLEGLEPMGVLKMHTRAAAHELKNIFGGLTLYLDLLGDEGDPTAELVTELRRSLEAGIAATKSLMELAAGAGDVDVPVDPRLVLGELQRHAQEALPEGVGLTTSYPEELWTVRCDVVRLYSELGRLVGAAISALPQGGAVAIKAENHRASGAPAQVVLAVSAFAEEVSSAPVETFLSRPLADDLPGREADPTTLEPEPTETAPGTLVCWRLHLPVEGSRP